MNLKQKLGFTLAEIMIVLTIIGVITAIILPVGINSMPDEDVMKFKKANNTLGNVIKELVSADNYYGVNLSQKNNNNGAVTAGYLCESLADVLSYKTKNCPTGSTGQTGYVDITSNGYKASLDTQCSGANNHSSIGKIVTNDGITYYDANPYVHFATSNFTTAVDGNGFLKLYKVFCVDVDGLNSGTAPFGYGIRVDGKVITGALADTWVEKNIQDKN